MLGLLISFPWLAAIPGIALFSLGWRAKSRFARNAGLAWLLYAVYEYLMKARVLCSGECNIRVDLLLLYPLLLGISVVALVKAVRSLRSQRQGA